MNIQKDMIKGTISVIDSRIEEAKAAHADLCKALDLEDMLLKLRRERNVLTNQLAPLSSLPNEVLDTIFEDIVIDTPSASPPIGITLSHISQ